MKLSQNCEFLFTNQLRMRKERHLTLMIKLKGFFFHETRIQQEECKEMFDDDARKKMNISQLFHQLISPTF